jgi:YgiT-type zinc finger domain-containing protein
MFVLSGCAGAPQADYTASRNGNLVTLDLPAWVCEQCGKPLFDETAVAAIQDFLDEDEMEDPVLAYSPRFRAILSKASRQIAAGEGLSEEEFWGEAEGDSPVLPLEG